jgi:hypothetical protein
VNKPKAKKQNLPVFLWKWFWIDRQTNHGNNNPGGKFIRSANDCPGIGIGSGNAGQVNLFLANRNKLDGMPFNNTISLRCRKNKNLHKTKLPKTGVNAFSSFLDCI